jgi:hypothetical protein
MDYEQNERLARHIVAGGVTRLLYGGNAFLYHVTLAEYEAIRAESTHFAVVPQHEQPEIEVVIERHPTYFVVEKREPDAQEVARETDPRA